MLEMRKIVKRFPGVLALNQVDLELKAGEVLSLLGENGAGKSTLIKILSGAQLPDSGEIVIEGELQHYKTPKEANEKGVAIIYQELNYLNDLTVAENIFLNRWPRAGKGRIDWKKMHQDAKAILASLDVDVSTKALMRNLSVAEKQLVEIDLLQFHVPSDLVEDVLQSRQHHALAQQACIVNKHHDKAKRDGQCQKVYFVGSSQSHCRCLR